MGSTLSRGLGATARFLVKKGMKSFAFSSAADKVAVKPIDWSSNQKLVSRAHHGGSIPTPLSTRRLMIPSRPTKAPLRMNSTFDVSIWYVSGFAVEYEYEDDIREGEKKTNAQTSQCSVAAFLDPLRSRFPVSALQRRRSGPYSARSRRSPPSCAIVPAVHPRRQRPVSPQGRPTPLYAQFCPPEQRLTATS